MATPRTSGPGRGSYQSVTILHTLKNKLISKSQCQWQCHENLVVSRIVVMEKMIYFQLVLIRSPLYL